MENIGPSSGRIASFINASGDFSFIKFDEILISPNLLTKAKLVVERNNLILMPPVNWEVKAEENREVSEDKCTHDLCEEVGGQITEKVPTFNNLKSNILIISRINGSCTVLNHNQSSNIYIKSPVEFDQCSSIFIDKYYHNLWTFNMERDEFARFNLITLAATDKISKIHKDRSKSNYIKFPSSWDTLHPLNIINESSNAQLDYILTLQPNFSIPFIENTNLKKTPQQLGIELLSLFTSLTYSHLFGIYFFNLNFFY